MHTYTYTYMYVDLYMYMQGLQKAGCGLHKGKRLTCEISARMTSYLKIWPKATALGGAGEYWASREEGNNLGNLQEARSAMEAPSRALLLEPQRGPFCSPRS